MLLDEHDNNFELLFNEFKTCTDNKECPQCFINYFKLEYSQHKHHCATYYRKVVGINTNMYVESFHQTLNYYFVYERQNQSMC